MLVLESRSASVNGNVAVQGSGWKRMSVEQLSSIVRFSAMVNLSQGIEPLRTFVLVAIHGQAKTARLAWGQCRDVGRFRGH